MAMAPERGSDEEFELDESLARGDVSVLARMFGGDQRNEFNVPRAVVEMGIQAAARMDTRGTTAQRMNVVQMFLADESVAAMRLRPEYGGKLLVDVALEQAVEPQLTLESPSVARVCHPDGTLMTPSIYAGLSDQQSLQLEWDLVCENAPIIHALVSHGATLAPGRTLERKALGKYLWRVASRRVAMSRFLFYWFGLAVERKYANETEAARMAGEWARMNQ